MGEVGGQSMACGSHIEIRGFGSFNLHHLAPRTGRNPSTGDKVEIPAIRTTIPKTSTMFQNVTIDA
jgi:nucleoid DNA-binding protein